MGSSTRWNTATNEAGLQFPQQQQAARGLTTAAAVGLWPLLSGTCPGTASAAISSQPPQDGPCPGAASQAQLRMHPPPEHTLLQSSYLHPVPCCSEQTVRWLLDLPARCVPGQSPCCCWLHPDGPAPLVGALCRHSPGSTPAAAGSIQTAPLP